MKLKEGGFNVCVLKGDRVVLIDVYGNGDEEVFVDVLVEILVNILYDLIFVYLEVFVDNKKVLKILKSF